MVALTSTALHTAAVPPSLQHLSNKSRPSHQEEAISLSHLQVAILVAGDHFLSCEKVEFGMEGKLRLLPLLEALHLLALPHPAGQDPAHALDAGLAQLVGFPAVIVNSSVGLKK